MEQLSGSIEPPSLSKDINHNTTTRSELEAYYRDLKLAEANASAAVPRYLALLKDERSRVEASARSLQIDAGTIRSALEGIDARHERIAALASKLLSAQSEFYRAYGNAIAIFIEQFGNYKVDAAGKFIFSSQSIANRYNAAADNLNRASNRMNELAKEKAQLIQSQQERWNEFVQGK